MLKQLKPFVEAQTEQVADTIGRSARGRSIEVVTVGQPFAPLRILFIAGQHGDEPMARGAVERFARSCQRTFKKDGVALSMIANLNPDGAAHGTRKNAEGIDLNRDHQRLRSAEIQALHRYVRSWQPHLIVDVHTYPARRKHLRRQGLVYCHDVFLDCPSNPSIRLPNGVVDAEPVRWIASRLNADGYLAGRYTLVRPSGRIRHGTPDLVDARNQFAVRYNIPTLLVEGRQISPRQDSRRTAFRVRRAMTRTLGYVIDWARLRMQRPTTEQDFAQEFEQDLLNPGDTVPIGCRYLPAERSFSMPFCVDGVIRSVELPGRFTPQVEATSTVSLPVAYAVPKSCLPVIETLKRHGFHTEAPPSGKHLVTGYQIANCTPSSRENRSPRDLNVIAAQSLTRLDDYLLYPVRQTGGHALAVFLEPSSKYGLARFASSGLSLTAGTVYPVRRYEP